MLNIFITSSRGKWNGNSVCGFGVDRNSFTIACRLVKLILLLMVLVKLVIFVGFMMLAKEGWARGGVRARGMDEGNLSLCFVHLRLR